MNQDQALETDRYHTLLLAIDTSEYGVGAQRVALALAARCRARLVFLKLQRSDAVDHEKELLLQQQIDGIGQRCREVGVTLELLTRQASDPAEGILEAVTAVTADMVIMGRRGTRGLARFKIGEATARVINKAPCKVLVVPRRADMWQKGILVAVDESDQASQVLSAAVAMAKLVQLPLTVLSVATSSDELTVRKHNMIVNRMVALARQEEVEAAGTVAVGAPEKEILAMVEEHPVDLIIGGEVERGSLLDKWFSDKVMYKVTAGTNLPVMLVKGNG
ncbi:MAG: universal stress protein [Magnetococcales bacterium]|nr:universal stress protein [Magnetococcales bacterium]